MSSKHLFYFTNLFYLRTHPKHTIYADFELCLKFLSILLSEMYPLKHYGDIFLDYAEAEINT